MVVTVTLQSIPQKDDRLKWGRQFDVTLLPGSTLAELIPDLGVELPLEETVLEFNGRSTRLDTVLHDGDQVKLIPADSDSPGRVMNVDVHLHTVLQRQTPEGLLRRLDLSMPADSTLKDLLAQLEINFPLDSLLLVVNGRLVEEDHILTEGDKVNLMPAISGG